jgi:ABC-type hemin transport system substrate-binding protein
VTSSVDGVLDTVDGSANIEGETMLEALLAAVVGAANTGKDMLAKEEVETEALVELGPEALLIALRQAAAQAAKIIAKIFFFL